MLYSTFPPEIPTFSTNVCYNLKIISRIMKILFSVPAESLWKGVTSVSNAGRKRGRAKTINKRNIKDLNRGQVIGIGKSFFYSLVKLINICVR